MSGTPGATYCKNDFVSHNVILTIVALLPVVFKGTDIVKKTQWDGNVSSCKREKQQEIIYMYNIHVPEVEYVLCTNCHFK